MTPDQRIIDAFYHSPRNGSRLDHITRVVRETLSELEARAQAAEAENGRLREALTTREQQLRLAVGAWAAGRDQSQVALVLGDDDKIHDVIELKISGSQMPIRFYELAALAASAPETGEREAK